MFLFRVLLSFLMLLSAAVLCFAQTPAAPQPVPTVVIVPTVSTPVPVVKSDNAAKTDNAAAGSPDAEAKETETPPAAPAIPIHVVAPPPALTDEQKEAREEQKEVVSRLANPNDLIEYFRSKYWRRQYEKAYACIDFKDTDPSEKTKRYTAFTLNFILSRLDGRDIADFPTSEKAFVQDFHTSADTVEIAFVLGEHGNWQFAYKTVRDLDRIYNLLRDEPPVRLNWLMKLMPAWFFALLFGVPWFRIILLALAFVLGFVLKWLVQWFLYRLTRSFFNLAMPDWDKSKLNRKTWKPVGLIVLVSFWAFGLIAFYPTPENFEFLQAAYIVFTTAMGVWMCLRLVDLFALWMRQKIRYHDPNIDIIFFPLFSRTVKLLFVCFGLFCLANAFQWSVFGLASGLGIGGIAVAFAAKETIANLFGSVTVLADRPFVIGDWIKTGDIEGTVESVGMRSTRIRTFYNSLVTIPNNNLTTAVIDNMGARYYRRYRTFLSVPLDTEPDRIEAFCEGIRELIRRHPYTRKDMFHVYLHEVRPASLDVLLTVFFVCPDSSIEFRERGRLISDILRVAKELGVQLALPAQVQYNTAKKQSELPVLNGEPAAAGRNAAGKVYPLEE
ncbi:MAG: mechanosensitive ion channel family protein [Planctomycetaceae bacterium]|jgi:MscS family membrane protein|nr:mechanosensitive ion channel family protein [Planctomycetaceae bacterium]